MDTDKDEIAEELAHHRKMLRELRRRLRERELQEVKHGINVPPEITSDIHDLTERVQRHESEIARLQTLAAEDKEPLGEVEYRAVLAEIWEKHAPTYAGLTRLELIRLRYGILRERANELEQEVRAIVAKELLNNYYGQYASDIISLVTRINDYFDENNEIDIMWPGNNQALTKHGLDRGKLDINVIKDILTNFASDDIRAMAVNINNIAYPIVVNKSVAFQCIVSRLDKKHIYKLRTVINNPRLRIHDDNRTSLYDFR